MISISEYAGLFAGIIDTGAALRIRVTGQSMGTFLSSNDIVTIRKVPAGSLQRGDLIFFKNRLGSLVLHRIMKINKSKDHIVTIQTKGDALLSFDEPIQENQVLGKVFEIEKINHLLGCKNIDLDSFFWKTVNFLILLKSLFKSRIFYPMYGKIRLLPFISKQF